MSETEQPAGDAGLTSRSDIKSHTAYTETIPTKKPKTQIERHINKSREIKIGSGE